ncbi:hypothetical protein Q8F55_006398 [Vanrija albida]|uniref:Major facilitator superfamily (MFS) profile domain-containing protein n=1 Tax=Vanrija albida TaxID=181172 RepID=A0ABR3PX70_9TREE
MPATLGPPPTGESVDEFAQVLDTGLRAALHAASNPPSRSATPAGRSSSVVGSNRRHATPRGAAGRSVSTVRRHLEVELVQLHPQQGLYVPSGDPLSLLGVEDGLAERAQIDRYITPPVSPIVSVRSTPVPSRAGSRAGSPATVFRSGSTRRASSPAFVPPSPRVHFIAPRPSPLAQVGEDEESDEDDGKVTVEYINGAGPDDLASIASLPDGVDFDNLSAGSFARRKAWRRPGARWILFFGIGATLNLGITSSSRAELYLDFACLAHPPQTTSDGVAGLVGAHGVAGLPGVYGAALGDWAGQAVSNASAVHAWHATTPVEPTPTHPGDRILSPGEKWFIDAQKDIYRWKNRKEKSAEPSPAPDPQPNEPSGGGADDSDDLPNAPPDPNLPPDLPPPFPHIDPAACKRDPGVQRAGAHLVMLLTVSTGLLSALTTGLWASVSDRIGRRKVQSVVQFGMFLNDVSLFTIASFPHLITHSYYLLLLGPIIDGILGGYSTATATMHAYISDVTPDGSRASEFGWLATSLTAGSTIGPVLGSTLISTTGNILSPFHFSIVCQFILTILIRFLLPESLSREARGHLRRRAVAGHKAASEREAAERAWEDADDLDSSDDGSAWSRVSSVRGRTKRRLQGNLRRFAKRLFAPLAALGVFLPQKVDGKLAASRQAWSMTYIGVLIFLNSITMGIVPFKLQYALFAFQWGPSIVGPYLSFISLCRVITLVVLLPIALRYARWHIAERERRRTAAAAAPSERTPLLANMIPGTAAFDDEIDIEEAIFTTYVRRPDTPPPPPPPPAPPAQSTTRSPEIDYWLLRAGMLAELVGYSTLSTDVPPLQSRFVSATAFITLGSAGIASANSLALNFLPNKAETGRLFGAIAVVHAVSGALISPIIFSKVFGATLRFYAPAVFALTAVALVLGQIVAAFIPSKPEKAPVDAEQT